MTGRNMATSILALPPVARARPSKAVTLYIHRDQARAIGEHGGVRPSVLTGDRPSCCSPQRVLLSRSAILIHRRYPGGTTMKNQILRMSFVLMSTGCLTWAGLSAETTTITGRVRDTNGSPLVARISIFKGPPAPGIETHDTNSSGAFSIKTSGAGIVSVTASASGYASQEVKRPKTLPFPPVTFILPALRVIQGHVQDAQGNGLAGIEVTVRYPGSSRMLQIDDGSHSITGDSGAFTLAAPLDGADRFVVDAFPDNWVPQSSHAFGGGAVSSTGVAEDATHRNILIRLDSKGSRVSGSVTSSSGRVLSGVTVVAAVKVQSPRATDRTRPGVIPIPGGVGRPFGKKIRKSTLTDSRGNYEIEGLPSGTLGVVALKRGIRIAVQRFTSTEGGRFTADFVIPG